MTILKRILYFGIICSLSLFIGLKSVPYVKQILLNLGIYEEEISIAGTGSMYPTFPKGEGKTDEIRSKQTVALPKMRRYPSGFTLLGNTYFSSTLARGDIVQFENDIVAKLSKEKYGEESGFVKRVIAVEGDTIELRDGYVKVNGKILDEPYIAKARSTYGGDKLDDCTPLEIPKGKLFVMGDNRKASLDSRFSLGLVDVADVKHILPLSEQKAFEQFWRDTKLDTTLANSSTLDISLFVRLLNEKRTTLKLKPLTHVQTLANSSKIRAQSMLDTNDFSSEATRSGMTLEKSLAQSGYDNIIFAELFTKGYYEAQELLDNFLEFPETRKILYSSEYQDIGIGVIVGQINFCPVQIIVAHLGGYVPPNYKQSDIDGWKTLISNLESVYPNWKLMQNADNVDKDKLNQLLFLFEKRITNAKQILSRMQANQWLTSTEKSYVSDDSKLHTLMEQLIEQLNKR